MNFNNMDRSSVDHCRTPAAAAMAAAVADSGPAHEQGVDFEDFLPSMAQKLGAEGLIAELCKGFELLANPATGVITFESLKRNAAMLGLEGLGDEEMLAMLQEGDLNGHGTLDQMEFCILMFRLSPDLMEGSQKVLEHALGMDPLMMSSSPLL